MTFRTNISPSFQDQEVRKSCVFFAMRYLGCENITVLRNVDIKVSVERRNIPEDFNL